MAQPDIDAILKASPLETQLKVAVSAAKLKSLELKVCKKT